MVGKPSNILPIAKPIMKSAARRSVTFNLPEPVSSNDLWGYGRGRVYKTKKYHQWMKGAGNHWLAQKPKGLFPTIQGKFALALMLNIERFGKIDLDNLIAAICDFLQADGIKIVSNDKWLFDLHVTWGLTSDVRISVIELPDA